MNDKITVTVSAEVTSCDTCPLSYRTMDGSCCDKLAAVTEGFGHIYPEGRDTVHPKCPFREENNGEVIMVKKKMRQKFMIGQRVIVSNQFSEDEIGTVAPGPRNANAPITERVLTEEVWVYSPSREYSLCFDESNVKPLPDGQL